MDPDLKRRLLQRCQQLGLRPYEDTPRQLEGVRSDRRETTARKEAPASLLKAAKRVPRQVRLSRTTLQATARTRSATSPLSQLTGTKENKFGDREVHRQVVSSLPLSDDVTELCLSLQTGLQLECTLVAQGGMASPSEREESDKIQVARDFSSCSEAVYEASKQAPNMKYITEQLQAATIKARQKLCKEQFLKEGHPDSVND
ncbi:hypothetical protein HPB47_013895 [Ixodes persulcatus]|uniref:Uncharacterized protein n=1 Tax=Ixodes persulcatus TaxID=34615 RepID=A0AC60QXC4_IXOPE|nr:hypothetical protein HPB47_013895 [Ixodes persulcatus]